MYMVNRFAVHTEYCLSGQLRGGVADEAFIDTCDLVNIAGDETDIMRYLADGRASFKDIHRRVQILIVDWLNKEGHGDNLDNRLTRKALLSVDDFGLWADYLALQLIFEDNRKAVDDVFAAKAKKYEAMAAVTRSRVAVAIDTNGDGVADVLTESVDIRSCRVMRR